MPASDTGSDAMPRDQETLGEQAHARLRHEILRGVFRPGQPLRLVQLQARTGYGFSPLREALTRLAAEGLVSAESMRGFRVAELSLDELRDTMETRIFIESEALRRSIASGDDDWEGRILAALHAFGRQLARSRPDDPDSLEALEGRHRDFHVALVSACGSPRLMAIVETLYLTSARYRMPGLARSEALPPRDRAAEHRAIAEAVLARDTPRAVALLGEHYRTTATQLEAACRDHLAAAG